MRVDNFDSSSRPCNIGVPQGSVLGPLLFSVYINDLPEFVDSRMLLYADDLKICRAIRSPSDIVMLQRDIDEVENWALLNRLTVNISKCKHLRVCDGNAQSSANYSFQSSDIERVNKYTDLGVWINSDLSTVTHTEHACSNALGIIGLLRRTFITPRMPRSHVGSPVPTYRLLS